MVVGMLAHHEHVRGSYSTVADLGENSIFVIVQVSYSPRIRVRNSPCPQRQSLQFQCCRPDVAPEGYDSNDHAHDVGHVVAIPGDIARTPAV